MTQERRQVSQRSQRAATRSGEQRGPCDQMPHSPSSNEQVVGQWQWQAPEDAGRIRHVSGSPRCGLAGHTAVSLVSECAAFAVTLHSPTRSNVFSLLAHLPMQMSTALACRPRRLRPLLPDCTRTRARASICGTSCSRIPPRSHVRCASVPF